MQTKFTEEVADKAHTPPEWPGGYHAILALILVLVIGAGHTELS